MALSTVVVSSLQNIFYRVFCLFAFYHFYSVLGGQWPRCLPHAASSSTYVLTSRKVTQTGFKREPTGLWREWAFYGLNQISRGFQLFVYFWGLHSFRIKLLKVNFWRRAKYRHEKKWHTFLTFLKLPLEGVTFWRRWQHKNIRSHSLKGHNESIISNGIHSNPCIIVNIPKAMPSDYFCSW